MIALRIKIEEFDLRRNAYVIKDPVEEVKAFRGNVK
jgi:hypothetical protein